MSDTDIQIIRRYDDDGLLEAAGVSWNEMRRPVLMAFVFPLFVLVFTTAASGFFMLAKGFPLKLVLLFGASVIALLFARKLLHRLGCLAGGGSHDGACAGRGDNRHRHRHRVMGTSNNTQFRALSV